MQTVLLSKFNVVNNKLAETSNNLLAKADKEVFKASKCIDNL